MSDKTLPWLRWIGAGLALISLVALLSHVFGVLPMNFFLTFFGVPSLLLLMMLGVYAKKVDAKIFLNCLTVGVLGGLVGTLSYDIVRAILTYGHVLNYDGFYAIRVFGGWISGKPPEHALAAIFGWIYHFWNGLSFGVFYTLTFGRRHWLIGVLYGLFMEACMLGLFPMFLRVSNRTDFIILSLIGHVFYGGALGLYAQRFGMNWSDSQ